MSPVSVDLRLVLFDTTSVYFEGRGPEMMPEYLISIGQDFVVICNREMKTFVDPNPKD